MADEFFRFPHTPHLLWLGKDQPRDDKVLSPVEAGALLRQYVMVEEKIDGANVGLSVDAAGDVHAQNRGAYLTRAGCHPQFKPLFQWLSMHRYALRDFLPRNAILFGEWCYAVHSVRYTRLPDWFLVFDVYDREQRLFWSVERRDVLAHDLGVELVPRVAKGRFSVANIPELLGTSQVSDGPAEGIYLKWAAGGGLEGRAKVVRSTFVQGIDAHWSARSLEVNQLASGATW